MDTLPRRWNFITIDRIMFTIHTYISLKLSDKRYAWWQNIHAVAVDKFLRISDKHERGSPMHTNHSRKMRTLCDRREIEDENLHFQNDIWTWFILHFLLIELPRFEIVFINEKTTKPKKIRSLKWGKTHP